MTGELAVFIIVSICSVIATIMLGEKFKEVEVPVYAMMFKVMIHQVGQPEYLVDLGIAEKMNTNN
jgi:hypothetical protein